jgi:pimeloyl-ACP methyl ester carboxylesterase
MTQREINGTSLEVIEQGTGETVVLVHGSVSDHRTWHDQQEKFAQSFHTVNYSRRYHWPNTPIPDGADYAMAEHVDDLATLIRSLDTEPVHLVGHSYGAFVCLLLAIRAPELLHTLVLAEPPVVTLFITIPPQPQQILKLLVTRPRTAVALINFAARGLNPATAAIKRDDKQAAIRTFGSAVLGRDAFNRLSPERREIVRANLINAEFLGSGFPPMDDANVRRVKLPTLLINGARSPYLFHGIINRLHDLLPNAQRIKIPAASHIMHEDNPQAYTAAVQAFLKQHAQVAEPV